MAERNFFIQPMTYAEKLRDPRWQRKRLEIFQRDGFQCQFSPDICSPEAPLHVHHKRYIKGRDPWDYDTYDLITVCSDCHELIESLKAHILSRLHDSFTAFAIQDLLELMESPEGVRAATILAVLLNHPSKRDELYDLAVAGNKELV